MFGMRKRRLSVRAIGSQHQKAGKQEKGTIVGGS